VPLVYFVTLSRSDYASIRPVARAALADPAIEAKIVVGGSHLLSRYGNTVLQIEKDGLPIHAVVDFLLEDDDSIDELSVAYAKAVKSFVVLFSERKPDYIFVIGDRWEMLAVVTAASMLKIPIVHHSGGDITHGSSDNQTRYALTCLSHLHLVALEEHRQRLMHVGEEKWRIVVTGEPALSEIESYSKAVPDIRHVLGLTPGEPFVLATFHPTSFDALPPEKQIKKFIQIIDEIKESIVLTAPNPDAASEVFSRELRLYADQHSKVLYFESLGTHEYYAAMAAAHYMIGNSSSGLLEAPSFHLPAINIGRRQEDRVHGSNVVNVPLELANVVSAINQVCDPRFRMKISSDTNPYYRFDTIELILNSFKQPYDRATLLAKRFVDPLSTDALLL